MATYYVTPGGTGATPTVDGAGAFPHIASFIDLPPATGDSCIVHGGTYADTGVKAIDFKPANHANKTFTISAAAGETPIVTANDITRMIYVGTGTLNGMTCTITGITFKPATGAGCPLIFEKIVNGTWTVNFVNCVLGAADFKSTIAKCTDNNAKSGTLSFTGCTLDASAMVSGGGIGSILESLGAMGDVIFDTCIVNCGGDYGWRISNTGDLRLAKIVNCTITTGAAMTASTDFVFYINDTGTYEVDRILIKGNTINSTCYGILIGGHCSYGEVSDNIVTINAANTGCGGIVVGNDGAIATTPPRTIHVLRNDVRQTGSTRGHCILLGRGLTSRSTCIGNITSGGDACMVIKSENALIAFNVMYHTKNSDTAMYIRSGVKNVIVHNTFYSATQYCIYLDHQAGSSGANTPTGNIITDNLFIQGAASVSPVLFEGAGQQEADIGLNLFDRNLYALAAGGTMALTNVLTRSWLAAGGTFTNDLAATNATPSVISSVAFGANFAAADVGRKVQVISGTNFVAGTYTITAQNGATATLDLNCCSGGAGSAGSAYEYEQTTTSTLAAMLTFWDALADACSFNDANSSQGVGATYASADALRSHFGQSKRIANEMFANIGAQQSGEPGVRFIRR